MAKKFRVGDCIDEHSIDESGNRFWSEGWRVDRDLGRDHYRILYAKGKQADGTVTWTGAKNMRKSNQCKITITEARRKRGE